jgi:hypothetical protein
MHSCSQRHQQNTFRGWLVSNRPQAPSHRPNTRPLWALLLTLATLLTGCTDSKERLWLKTPGWSRAQLVGHTQVTDPVSVALDAAGGIYLFLIDQTNGASTPRVVALDQRMETRWDRTYDIELAQTYQPQILWNGQEIELFWINDQALYHTQLDIAGNLIGQPATLSGGVAVDSYDVALSSSGSTTVWFAGPRRHPGLYALPRGLASAQDSQPIAEPTLVDAEGIWPDLQVDRSGTLHAIWTHYPPGYENDRLFYSAYPEGLYRPGQETIVAEPRLGTSITLARPRLGLDEGQVYIFWTEITRSGASASRVETNYTHFPYAQPSQASAVRQLFVPSAHNLSYRSAPDGNLKSGERAALNDSDISDITDLITDPGQARELVIAFRAHIDYLRHQEQGQISTVFFKSGDPTAYQLLTFTPASSTNPAVVSDQAGQLYVTWLEQKTSAGWQVFFASTAPEIRGALGALTRRDVGRLVAETLFGLLGGALLIPMVLIWMMAAGVVLGLASVVRWKNTRMLHFGSLFSLALAFAAYWTSKLFTLPGMVDYVPFSAWFPAIPSWSSTPLRWGVPLLFAGLGLVVAWNFSYRRSNPSKFLFVLIATAIDGVLTTAVYGVLFYGGY